MCCTVHAYLATTDQHAHDNDPSKPRPRVHRARPPDYQPTRTLVVVLWIPFLSSRYVPLATTHPTLRFCSGLIPQLLVRCEDKSPCARITVPPGWAPSWPYISPRCHPIRKARPPVALTRTKPDPQSTPITSPNSPNCPPITIKFPYSNSSFDRKWTTARTSLQNLRTVCRRALVGLRRRPGRPLRFNRDAFRAAGQKMPPVWPRPPRSRELSRPIRSLYPPPTYD